MPIPKKKILIVDDDESITRMLMLNLHHTGHYIVHVENDSAAAFPAARKFEPDLMILDVMMPGQDGGDLAARFRADSRFRSVPIIFLTAAVKPTESGVHGGDLFLAKPVDPDVLIGHIEAQLKKTEQASASSPPSH
jgi:DNA-binding response OmpR family regulator